MVDTFEKENQELREKVHRDRDRIDETFKVGVEIEGCLLDKNGNPVDAEPLIKELEGSAYEIDYEYGRSQFEFKTLPVRMDNLEYLNTVFEQFIEILDKFLK
ncbi:MAG TPA: hypothetical protein VF248_06045, partial [Nitrososphaeraceae archaeon]